MTIPKVTKFASVIMGLSLAGCSAQNTLSLGVDDPCASLKGIIADYPSGFEQYRGSASDFRSVTVYSATEQIIRGHCEIWAWANNDSAYVCSGNTPDDEVATTRYDAAVTWMDNCLGDGWQAQESERIRDGENAGMVTRFRSLEAEMPNVSVHKVAFRRDSAVYVYVGTPSRLAEF
ncbi:hypothetical protein [Marinobacter sp.]|uniref:hypothetical protein n=1 Tax=Marinobacter sp. TaxID=50741 RepID=UPI003A945B3B